MFPHELEGYRKTLEQLAENNISPCFILFVTLNLNPDILDWCNTSSTKKSIVSLFDKINSDFPQFRKITITTFDKKSTGVNAHRIYTYEKFKNFDYIFFLDTDLVFSNQIIKSYLSAFEELKNKKGWYIITPEVLRLWDTTWDCLVNKHFINNNLNSYKNTNIDQVHHDVRSDNRKLRINQTIKFAGGWFTCFQPNLLNFIGIPSSFGGYGPDDTYIMACIQKLKTKGYIIDQYIIENEIVTERPVESSLDVKLKISAKEQRELAMTRFYSELNKFSKKL